MKRTLTLGRAMKAARIPVYKSQDGYTALMAKYATRNRNARIRAAIRDGRALPVQSGFVQPPIEDGWF